MGLYEGIKDVAKVIQHADNIEIYKQLIELSAQALDMQNEITRLSNENAELKKAKDIADRIERHSEPFITLKNDNVNIIYCSTCWDKERKLIQTKCYESGEFKCTNCDNAGVHDEKTHTDYINNRKSQYSNYKTNRRNNFW